MALKEKSNGLVGITGYEIKQGFGGSGQMTLHLTVINYGGKIETFGKIIDEFNDYLKERGLSIGSSQT